MSKTTTTTYSKCSAILTRRLGWTDTQPDRVVAELAGTGKRPRVVLTWDHNLDTYANHEAAALELCAKNPGWLGDDAHLVAGGTATGYAFVFVPNT